MGLRAYLNDLETSRKINYSKGGRKFENGDFARNVEFTYVFLKDEIRNQTGNRFVAVLGSVIRFPLVFLEEYNETKQQKYKNPEFYNLFLNNSNLILNR